MEELVLDKPDEKRLRELQQPCERRSHPGNPPERGVSEGVGGEGEEGREDKLPRHREDDEERDERRLVVHHQEQAVHHGEEGDDDESKARSREDEPREARGRAEHHRDKPEGKDDVKEALEPFGLHRIREERLHLGPDGAEEEALAEDVHREEAHQVPELHRHDLFQEGLPHEERRDDGRGLLRRGQSDTRLGLGDGRRRAVGHVRPEGECRHQAVQPDE
mmetsp:Transcript_21106/g.50911  ORF Transcript_21106/g.50911 Transcript_21106/m.50911 type:complete len:220 (-) Transcript_21106:665-1324(-)